MKLLRNRFAIIALLVPVLGISLIQADQTPNEQIQQEMANSDKSSYGAYSKDDLVMVRVAWAGQEYRLGQLVYEARNLSGSHKVDYFSGCGYVATINDNDKTITTHLSKDKSVTLSYEVFTKLLNDKEINSLANNYLREKAKKRNTLGYFLSDLYYQAREKLYGA